MATMIKEKRRDKKRPKEKSCVKNSKTEIQVANDQESIREINPSVIKCKEDPNEEQTDVSLPVKQKDTTFIAISSHDETNSLSQHTFQLQSTGVEETHSNIDTQSISYLESAADLQKTTLNVELSLGKEANLKSFSHNQEISENAVASAPMLEDAETLVLPAYQAEIPVIKEVIKLNNMSIDEATRIFCGAEMTEIILMSDYEEAIVEMGPISGPENPLIDLLSTFRRSLIAIERENTKLFARYKEEEKFRSTLWKIEKQYINETVKCRCGLSVNFKVKYDLAELQKEKLPVARMKLEYLLRELQESYCHHQHEALLAYYQIEHLLTEIMKTNKVNIREALTLVLQALKLSDNCPETLATALEKWAVVLAAALVDQRDLRQLLFIIQHLFRQNRSVKWAASVVNININDTPSAARALALMELLFAKTRVDAAVECVEDKEDVWEEVDKDGGGGAVSDGTLRERDLLALLRAFPMRDLVASIVSFPISDVRVAHAHEWCEGARGVIRASCGVRVLARIVGRACRMHAHYKRLQRELSAVLLAALRALAAMHCHHKSSYPREAEVQVSGELQAAFAGGAEALEAEQLPLLPAALLSEPAARQYCLAHALLVRTHADESSSRVDALDMELPPLPCAVRVRIVARAAADRCDDYDLARFALDFLFQVGICRNSTAACKGVCRQAACEAIASLLDVHSFLYPIALHLVAESSQVEKIEASSLEWLSVAGWRPHPAEIRAVLDDWRQRCPHLVAPLLLRVDCRPHVGISLECQLAIGSWLCEQPTGSEGADWRWGVLRRLRTHRSCWTDAARYDAPPPDTEPSDLISKAYALLATSWGHCIPLICSQGVEALCELAASRVSDALHCFAGVAAALAASPDSVAATPRFGDLFATVMNAGPGLVQRALGRGGAPGAALLLRLLLEQLPRTYPGISEESLSDVWACGLWRDHSGAAAALELALLAAGRPALARRARGLAAAQDETSQRHIAAAAGWAGEAPLVAAHALWAWHARREVRDLALARALDAVHAQRTNRQRIHVDNALKALGLNTSAEDLVVHRAANAALVAPSQHPAHLMLWHLFMHIYLQRPPSDTRDTTPPVGPLFFSGLFKSRTLAQLKRRLREVIKYHGDEANSIKIKQQQPSTPIEPRTSRSQSKSISTDDTLTTPLSTKDLVGESSDSSDVESDQSEERDGATSESTDAVNYDNLLAYHVGAERLLCEYARWLDDGDSTRAQWHHSDIARFITEQALEAAYQEELVRRKPVLPSDLEPLPLPPTHPLPPPLPKKTPFEEVKDILFKIKQRSRNRSRRCRIISVVEDVDFKDVRGLLNLVEKHLKDVVQFSQEWCAEAEAAAALDRALCDLVRRLRAPRALPPLRAACAAKCAPLTHRPEGEEWCISIGAEQGIKENRRSARAAMRRLARPRLHVARTAAALLAIARSAGSAELGRRMAESAWRSAGGVRERCRPAAAIVAAVLELLADRWLCWDGRACAEVLSRWGARGGTALQQEAATALLAPRRVPPPLLPLLHGAVLRSRPPPRAAFCRLSKFEMGKWAKEVDGTARREMALALVAAAQRWGPTPSEDEEPLVELLGVQMHAVCTSEELVPLTRAASLACRARTLPPPVLRNICRAAADTAAALAFDQLGHLLRELGVSWWEARTQSSKGVQYDDYASNFADLLAILQLAFVDAAVRFSYTPEKVGCVSWGSALEAWAPWLAPHDAPPLVRVRVRSAEPAGDAADGYGEMAASFFDLIAQIMERCPGCEESVMSSAWEWMVQVRMCARAQGDALSMRRALLTSARAANLPWDAVQWLAASTPHVLVKVAESGDSDLCEWTAECVRAQRAATWLRGSEDHVAGRLALLLYLFTASPLNLHQQTLDEACLLPWCRLPEMALEEVLQRFFCDHHNLATPYHCLPQFRVILFASELCWVDVVGPNLRPGAREKRACLVSQWVRASASPPLLPHAAGAARALATLLARVGPHLESSAGELEELLDRALVITCIEPAASAVVAEWRGAVGAGDARWVRACVRGASALTAYEPFAALADAALAAYMQSEGASWSEAASLWERCVWGESAGLCSRARLHAAYAVCVRNSDCAALRAALQALLAADINFVQSEAIVSAWICVAGRVSAAAEGDEECAAAARALLAKWSRWTLLSLVSIQEAAKPTAHHRTLCLLAQCICNPGDESMARAYEAACPAGAEASRWARSPPSPRLLPRLAARLMPHAAHYFDMELKLTPERDASKE